MWRYRTDESSCLNGYLFLFSFFLKSRFNVCNILNYELYILHFYIHVFLIIFLQVVVNLLFGSIGVRHSSDNSPFLHSVSLFVVGCSSPAHVGFLW